MPGNQIAHRLRRWAPKDLHSPRAGLGRAATTYIALVHDFWCAHLRTLPNRVKRFNFWCRDWFSNPHAKLLDDDVGRAGFMLNPDLP